MIDPAVARCATCGTSYTVRSWYWLEPLDRAGDRRACAVPGCGFPVERASTTALRLATEGRDAANDPPTMIDSPKRSESPMKPKKTTAKKPAPEAPAIISIRGVRPEDHAAFVRAQARISAQAGGAFVSLSQAVLVLARRQAAREDAEEAARAAAQRTPARDELVRRVIDARRAVEETTREGWAGSVADRAALVAAEEEALAALAQDADVIRAAATLLDRVGVPRTERVEAVGGEVDYSHMTPEKRALLRELLAEAMGGGSPAE